MASLSSSRANPQTIPRTQSALSIIFDRRMTTRHRLLVPCILLLNPQNTHYSHRRSPTVVLLHEAPFRIFCGNIVWLRPSHYHALPRALGYNRQYNRYLFVCYTSSNREVYIYQF